VDYGKRTMEVATAISMGVNDAIASDASMGLHQMTNPRELFPGDENLRVAFLYGQIIGNMAAIEAAAGQGTGGSALIESGLAEAGATWEAAESGYGALVPAAGLATALGGTIMVAHSGIMSPRLLRTLIRRWKV
jgi:hypothetical protein